MRKLASVRTISDISPIAGADAIEVATVDGWKVVVKKNEFSVGDIVIYLEVDSFVPYELAPFLSKGKEPSEFNGVKGERLRTVRLRGQLSQGLILPFYVLPDSLKQHPSFWDEVNGFDVTEALGIQKWEAPVPTQLSGTAKGNFPSFIPKTDQERVQNITRELTNAAQDEIVFEVSEKLEGSSMTVYIKDGVFGVCSRNIDLVESEGNAFWDTANKLNIKERLLNCGFDNIAIQGELVGPGIQGNIYELTEHKFYVFDIYDIKAGAYFPAVNRLAKVDGLNLDHAPVLDYICLPKENTLDELLSMADGVTQVNGNHLREGLVFKATDGSMSFKVISNKYLLKEK